MGGLARPEGSDGLLLPSTEGARGKAGKGSVALGTFRRYRRGRLSAGPPHLCEGQRFGFKVEKVTKRRH